MQWLSYNYENGEGVPVDLAKAYVWGVMGYWWERPHRTFFTSDDTNFGEAVVFHEEDLERLQALVSKMDAADKAAAQELFLEVWERLRFISHNHDDFGDPLPANYPGVPSQLLVVGSHESN